ncbi:MAG: hypothetical protein QOI37_368 [Chloroflexota bacterium]|jgi:hypothetical protein|nr:hypothetical protein [Chloroflexota bacterium]
MRRQVVAADVGLDLDDPPDAPTRLVVPDEAGADQGAGGIEGRTRQERPVDDAQPPPT